MLLGGRVQNLNRIVDFATAKELELFACWVIFQAFGVVC